MKATNDTYLINSVRVPNSYITVSKFDGKEEDKKKVEVHEFNEAPVDLPECQWKIQKTSVGSWYEIISNRYQNSYLECHRTKFVHVREDTEDIAKPAIWRMYTIEFISNSSPPIQAKPVELNIDAI